MDDLNNKEHPQAPSPVETKETQAPDTPAPEITRDASPAAPTGEKGSSKESLLEGEYIVSEETGVVVEETEAETVWDEEVQGVMRSDVTDETVEPIAEPPTTGDPSVQIE